MRLSNGMCKLCTIEVETIEHMFYECELVEKVWAILAKVTNEIWKVNCDSLRYVIFSQTELKIDSEITVIMELIVMSTKWILWKRRCLLKYDDKWTSEDDTIRWVISYLLKRIELLSEVKINTKIRNELDKFTEAIKARN